jgi:Mor family transcriptional regulator
MSSFIPSDDDDYPELLIDIAEQVALRVKAHVPNEEEARRIGYEVAEHIRNHHAGEMIYFPRGRKFEARRLHQELWEKFTGNNVPDLAKEYKMAEPSVYRILKFMKEQQERRSQMSLLGEP